jgi:hypothetical protein
MLCKRKFWILNVLKKDPELKKRVRPNEIGLKRERFYDIFTIGSKN